MHTTLKWLVTLVLCLLSLTAQAQQRNASDIESGGTVTPGKRVALVIGNGKYDKLRKLDNPKNDAKLIETTLRDKLGFTILGGSKNGLDLNAGAMTVLLSDFSDEIRGAEIALIYYAGHGGADKQGEQYLLGIEYSNDQRRVNKEGLALNEVMERISEGGAKSNLVFLDACREPLRGNGIRALTPKKDAPNTVVFYATAAEDTAADGSNGNSPFTRAVAAEMVKPGEWRDFELAVSKRVKTETNGMQEPKLYGQLVDRFYFYGPTTVIVPPSPPPPPPVDPEQEYWNEIKMSNYVQDFEDYLKYYPKGKFVPQANLRVRQLQRGEEQERLKREAETARKAEVAKQAEALRLAQAQEADRKAKEAAAELARQEAKRKADAGLPPGKAFKDCADCPEMVVIPTGSFQMGSDTGGSNEKPVHTVTIGKSFALGKTEVTQAQWKAVMGSAPPELKFKDCGDDCPVERVSWNDAQEFIKKLNAKTGKTYRLPSEAEWEYACRAGGNHTYCGGNDLDAVAWYGKNSDSKTHPVAGKQENAFGLYDMSGNLWEWVEDCYHDSYKGAPVDGSAWTSGDCTVRVARGGSWSSFPGFARAALRDGSEPADRGSYIGFRLARMLP